MRVLIDLSEFLRKPLSTGIQRVCGHLCEEWPSGIPLQPVMVRQDGRLVELPAQTLPLIRTYFACRGTERDSVERELQSIAGQEAPEVSLHSGDPLLAPELFYDSVRLNYYARLPEVTRRSVYFIVYDFLPLTHPHWFHPLTDYDVVSSYFRILRDYSNLAFISAATQDAYCHRILRSTVRLGVVLPLGANGLRKNRPEPRTVPPAGAFVAVGTIEPRKRPDLILDVFEAVSRERPELRLVFCGRVGWAPAEITERIRKTAQTCRWLSVIENASDEEICAIIRKSRATVFVSQDEGYGLPPVESLWLGTPVIAHGGIPSLEPFGDRGIELLPQVDGDRLKQAVLRMLDDSHWRKKAREAGQLELPTWESFAAAAARWVTGEVGQPWDSSVPSGCDSVGLRPSEGNRASRYLRSGSNAPENAPAFDGTSESPGTMSPAKPTDVAAIMREIRDRVRQKRLLETAPAPEGPDDPLLALGPALDGFRAALSELRGVAERTGDSPPRPPTFRGTVGAALSRLIRRALFWQYHETREFQASSIRALDQAARAFDAATSAISRVSAYGLRIQELSARMQKQSSRDDEISAALSRASARIRELTDRSERVETELSLASEAVQRLMERARELSDENEALRMRLEPVHESVAEISKTLPRLKGELSAATHISKREGETVQDIVGRLQSLTAEFNALSRRVQDGTRSQSNEADSSSDDPLAGICLALADSFRGPRDEIVNRLGVYLPILKEVGLRPGADLVVDLGCGRGEWLQLLSQNGYRNIGCEPNPLMAEICEGLGLAVARQPAREFLESLPEGSVDAVTAFHLIEHLPPASLLALLDGCLRALRPGGLLILETPNPQNILVGCYNFHLDPTHQKPLPVQLLRFLVETRGFREIRSILLHPCAEPMRLQDKSEVGRRFNEYFYGPQDYSVIAKRP